jgi:hypothetical protein
MYSEEYNKSVSFVREGDVNLEIVCKDVGKQCKVNFSQNN